MEKTTLTLIPRLRVMQSDLTGGKIQPVRILFYLVGWLITFFFLVLSIEIGSFTWMQIWILMCGIFWYQLNRNILDKLYVLPELLILFLLLFCGLQIIYWDNLYNALLLSAATEKSLGFLPGLISGLILLCFGFLLISDSEEQNHVQTGVIKPRHRQGILIWYLLLGYGGHYIVFPEHHYYLYLFQFVLLLFLLNHTRWLEKLSRRELWIYFWVGLVIFFFFSEPDGVDQLKSIRASQNLTWLSFPLYMFLSVKMYVLALLIRIPIVIIYNHAKLSGKLKIAGLFQSTFPQFFQFIFLIIIFYFFISSWQAQEMRRVVEEFFKEPLKYSKDLNIETTYSAGVYAPIMLSGFEPFLLNTNLPENGVVRLNRDTGHPEFLIYQRDADNTQQISFVHIDTLFCNTLARNIPLLVGNGVMLYSFTPKTWQLFFYEKDFFDDNKRARIYPFDISTNISGRVMTSAVEESRGKGTRIVVFGRDISTYRQKLTVGRILFPMVSGNSLESSLFSFDIFLSLQTSFFPSTMSSIVLYLIILYFLFNLFIIRRVGKFGEQINKMIIQKFEQLKTGIREISSGDLEYKLHMEGEDEFVELANHFNRMGGELKQKIAEAREKDRLDHELQIARQVQINLLPAKLPPVTGYEVSASMKTAHEVGGDFYDLIPLGNNRYLFTVGDVSGKGSSAAFYMAQFISLLRYSPQFSDQPLDLARRLNDYFSTQLADRQVFVTAILGILDATKNKIEYVRAGHNFPIVIPGDKTKKIQEIDSAGLGIGLTKSEKKFIETLKLSRLNLRAGDKLVLFTDGVVEAAIEQVAETSAEVFGEERFLQLLQTNRDKTGRVIAKNINQELDKFYGDHPRIDDHTLFIINRLGETKE